jgi:excisionase family DNA binding protein
MGNIIVTSVDELKDLIQNVIRKSFEEYGNKQPNQEQDRNLSISEASEFLNLAKQTLYGFTSKNEIPFIKKGKKLYFKKSDLQKWLLEGKQKSKSEIRRELDK